VQRDDGQLSRAVVPLRNDSLIFGEIIRPTDAVVDSSQGKSIPGSSIENGEKPTTT
jgi:hypothetical protein